eukprot:TRINITY_DN665_c0_g2_i1.p3 TRINITY_DN665_c0_g2~~TRINITY_DN665_c0_g2_i1.p3  ORF type:complete len:108 (+),score=47.17 TRINITY_DN665_c0_g2_i1:68-391(+)
MPGEEEAAAPPPPPPSRPHRSFLDVLLPRKIPGEAGLAMVLVTPVLWKIMEPQGRRLPQGPLARKAMQRKWFFGYCCVTYCAVGLWQTGQYGADQQVFNQYGMENYR